MLAYKIFQEEGFSKDDLNAFLAGASEARKSFRYFNNRDISVISGHLCTILQFEGNTPVCYGHLDIEKDIVWLGICVADAYKGKGLGSAMMSRLISYATNMNLSKISLSVDLDNIDGIRLYRKFNFEVVQVIEGKYQIMERGFRDPVERFFYNGAKDK
jgi:RimJ/RimL family protein N-acetyltransferase